MKEFDSLTDNRPMILKLAEKQAGMAHKNLFEPAFTLGKPSKNSKHYKESMAMDACCRNVLSGALHNDLALSAFPMFVGYGMLSNLSQEGLIRAGVETIADDMTRKPIEPYYDDEGGEEEEDKITKLKTEMIKYKVREAMNTALLKDGYFGGCLVYIDVGELEDDEAEEPLVLDEKTFKKGSLRGFKVIEPVNIAPGTYNTTDPTSDNYFNPEWYYILGRKYHKTRFLYFASNETPLLLKAAYNFFGIPQAQLALDYVAHFVANRESAQKLLNKFSLTCFGTDMSQGLQANGSWSDLVKRMKMFNKIRDNNGAFVYNKETEELSQINTPLGGVREIVEMSLNLLTAIWRIPKIRYIGEGEGGMNASSVEQMRSYYDYINAMQEKVLTTPYETVLKILQLNLGMKPDEKLLFKFPVLWDMDEQERANLNKIKADTMATYLANGIISQEEARRSLSMDRNSGFTMLDAEDVPEPVEEPLKDVDKKEQDEEDKEAMDEWVESKHPRDRMGRFAEKSGGSSGIDYKKDSSENFSDYALRFDQTDVDAQSVLNGLRSYVSEAGKTHQPKEMEKAIFDVEKKISEGEETVDKYRISGRRDQAVYTPERELLHEKIVDELLKGKKQSENPTFILLGGRGGSGKSRFNGEVYDKKDFVVLDADKIKEMLPEYEGWNAAHLHEESADILERALTTAKKYKLNVVLDATMNGLNTTKRRLDLFKDGGYHTEMHYMFLPRQKAASRAITRFVDKPKGRYVPIDKILNMRDNEKNFQELTKYVDAYSFSNNDVPFGSMPKLVEKRGEFYYKNGAKKWI